VRRKSSTLSETQRPSFIVDRKREAGSAGGGREGGLLLNAPGERGGKRRGHFPNPNGEKMPSRLLTKGKSHEL